MARRTKQEALATRDALLDAAEAVFEAQGVAYTSLSDIAGAAGVTRGAVYWHFRDKADLFNAMMSRAVLPLEQQWLGTIDPGDPVGHLRETMLHVLRQTATEPRLQRVFSIATQKVEYVDELSGIRTRHVQVRLAFLKQLEKMLRMARSQRLVRTDVSARTAAVGLHALLDGLIGNWMLDRSAFDLVRVGRAALETYIAGLAPQARVAGPGRTRARSR